MHNGSRKVEQAPPPPTPPKKQKKKTGEYFTTKLKSICKNSGTFEGKKTSPQKSHLGQSCTKPFNYSIMVHFTMGQWHPAITKCNGTKKMFVITGSS